ncbi:MAG: hypothetical protein R3355_00670 [Pseudomonas sp.]|uniref:hypothetical protein n=1 Tax=Pseudomonas sp. TaxID=306 RepID=UPI00299D04FE|nr:hypothetical protein [Pseudomonas sp.]MDX1721601.1 hypothetical protein [Pseudomonas sp.]
MIPIQDFLRYVDLSELHDKICQFRELDFKKLSYQEVQNEISNVITFNTPHGNIAVLTPGSGSYPAGTRFYRVRSIDESDRNIPLKSMNKICDCWEPPSSIVSAGRLNKEKEGLLYTSPMHPHIAVEEMKIKDGQLFSLIVYEALEPVNVTIIGAASNPEGLSKDEILKSRMIQDFLRHEFIRDVGSGTEYLYRISESIAKDYFDLPPDFHDAWCYPSVAKKGGYNTCFRPASRSKLKLCGVQIASITRQNDDYLFHIKMIAKDSGDGQTLSYHAVGSEEQSKIFPEISVAKI